MRDEEANDIDDVLSILGTGRWNIGIFVLCSLSFMKIPPHVLSGAFVAPALNFSCVVPPSGGVVQDLQPNTTWPPHDPRCYYHDSESHTLQPCTQWTYDTSVFASTVTSQYNMVCDRAYLRSTYSSIYMFGAMFGSIIVGYLADWKGRKVVLTLGIVGFCLFPLGMTWIPSVVALMLFRFLLGVSHPILLTSFYAIAMEVCEAKHRAGVGILAALPWALGTMAWGALAYGIRDWQWLNLAVTLPCFLFIPCIWYIKESPRWLVVHGQHDEAIDVLRTAAALNKTRLPSDQHLRRVMLATQQSVSRTRRASIQIRTSKKMPKYLKEFRLLFSTPQLRLRTFVMWLLFFVASMVFYGLSLSAVTLSADPFMYMIISGLMEIPSYTITVPIIDYWGRRVPSSIAYLMCGVTILSLAFIPKEMNWLVMVLAMSGKLAISMAYQVVYMYLLELLPTEVRLQALGTSMLVSRIGAILSPFITDNLGESVPWLPSAIFGCLSLLAGVATLLLPDTMGLHMPDTVQEMERTWQLTKQASQRTRLHSSTEQHLQETELKLPNNHELDSGTEQSVTTE